MNDKQNKRRFRGKGYLNAKEGQKFRRLRKVKIRRKKYYKGKLLYSFFIPTKNFF
jgi:hypothetical protein